MNYTFKDTSSRSTGFLIASLHENSRLKLQRQRPFEQEWQDYSTYISKLPLCKRLLQHDSKTGMVMDNNYFNYYLENALSRMSARLIRLAKLHDSLQQNHSLMRLQTMTHDILLIEKGSPHFRLTLYLTFWTKLFNEQKRQTKELAALESINRSTIGYRFTRRKIVILYFIRRHHAVRTNN